jgi:hypothetical protein
MAPTITMCLPEEPCAEPMNPPEMNDDPNQIADDLIEQHGVDGALDTVREGIAETGLLHRRPKA